MFAQRPRTASTRAGAGPCRPTGVHDPQRLAAVRRLLPLRRPPSPNVERITRMAAQLLEAPVSLLTLVDADHQFFVSSYGLDEPLRSAGETPIDYSGCQHVVESDGPLIVPDAREEPKLEGNRAVEELGVRAYAGSPVRTREGHAVGATCVVDFVPRQWEDGKVALLDDLAALAADELRLVDLERQADFEQRWRGIPHR